MSYKRTNGVPAFAGTTIFAAFAGTTIQRFSELP